MLINKHFLFAKTLFCCWYNYLNFEVNQGKISYNQQSSVNECFEI